MLWKIQLLCLLCLLCYNMSCWPLMTGRYNNALMIHLQVFLVFSTHSGFVLVYLGTSLERLACTYVLFFLKPLSEHMARVVVETLRKFSLSGGLSPVLIFFTWTSYLIMTLHSYDTQVRFFISKLKTQNMTYVWLRSQQLTRTSWKSLYICLIYWEGVAKINGLVNHIGTIRKCRMISVPTIIDWPQLLFIIDWHCYQHWTSSFNQQ
jgi:hypothetical protein